MNQQIHMNVSAEIDPLAAYILILHADPTLQEACPIVSSIPYASGSACFWQDSQNADYWRLVLIDESMYNPDTNIYEDDKFWGDAELLEDSCNSEYLTPAELYSELSNLPNVDRSKLYGLRSVFDKYFKF